MPDLNKLIAEKGVESIEEIQTWLQSGKDFVSEQAPLVVNEILKWGIASSIFWMVFGILLLIIAVIAGKIAIWTMRNGKPTDDGDVFVFISTIITTMVTSTAGFLLFSVNTYNLIFMLFAPRLYILDELSKLLK